MNNIFENISEFYPTPPELIAKMLLKIDLTLVDTVLEPSAGKGDIVKFCEMANDYINDGWRYKYVEGNTTEEKEKYIISHDVVDSIRKGKSPNHYHRGLKIEAIEINSNLVSILKDSINDESCVIQGDFLEFDGEKHYDLIIMNPPFSNGDEHLLKAISIAEKTGSQIVCLLNAETIRNPFANRRKELLKQLAKYNAEYEYVTDAFAAGSGAERTTDVDVVIVSLTVPSPFKSCSRIWEELEEKEEEIEMPDAPSEMIAADDELKAAVKLYRRELEAGKRLITEYLALKPYLSSHFEDKDTPSYMKGSNLYLCTGNDHESLDWNKYVYSVRYKYWYELLHKPSFMQNLTSNIRDEYFSSIREFANKDFSLKNIYDVKMDILRRTAKGIEDKIVSLFEKLSYEHSMGCEKNIHYFNGWKSNSAFIINNKVVVPYIHCWEVYIKKFRYNYNIYGFLDDIEKCLDFLDGGETVYHSTISIKLNFYEEIQETRKLDFKYFTVDVYKKGTIHIKFKDAELLKRLNIYGCQHKGWLPPSYGKKAYKDMTAEEKAVIDGFEGEEEYNKVFAHPERYIVAPEKEMLLLGA